MTDLQPLIAYLSQRYPGGTRKFTSDGGIAVIGPGDPLDLVVYLPQWDEPTKNIFKEFVSRFTFNLRLVDTKNFEGMDEDSIKQDMESRIQRILDQAPCPAAISINPVFFALVTHPEESIENAEALLDLFMEELTNVVRFYMIRGKDVVYRERAKKVTIISSDHSGHNRVISSDDITNLRIALENATSIDDLINSL